MALRSGVADVNCGYYEGKVLRDSSHIVIVDISCSWFSNRNEDSSFCGVIFDWQSVDCSSILVRLLVHALKL